MSRLLTLACLLLTLTTVPTSFAAAADAGVECEHIDANTGACSVTVHVGGTPGSRSSDSPSNTGNGSACYWDPSKQGLSGPPAGPVDCSSIDGYWSNTHNCYIQTAKPQPPAGDPIWQGHDPSDGAIYNCSQPQTALLIQIWSATPPAGGGPTPGEVAQLAVKDMGLSAITIGIAPKPDPDSVGLVGMPVWMWAADPDDATVGPITRDATAGGITATATATLESITWDMGDGHSVVCHDPGQPYDAAYGMRESPGCGYTYTTTSAAQPGQHFTVTATSQWVVSWSGAGQTGTIRPAPLIRTTQITIGEAQVLVQ
ncbi:MAG: hypothetical protein ACXVHX_02070 [Solirubrobacteraceae bacterium]